MTGDALSIGQVARRTGLSVSAIRFYESRGLVSSTRNEGGQRRFRRSDIRRLSFVLIAQQLGFTIEQIGAQLASLPSARTPTQRDWSAMSRMFRRTLDERINALTRMRERLDGCIGCGCLSLRKCAIYNADDAASEDGPGPRHLLGERRASGPGWT